MLEEIAREEETKWLRYSHSFNQMISLFDADRVEGLMYTKQRTVTIEMINTRIAADGQPFY